LGILTFNGKATTGAGEGKKYLALPWVKEQINQTLGFSPYLGTLNLTLTRASLANKKLLKRSELKIHPAEGYCLGLLFHASIHGTPCAVVVPQVDSYPENVLELIAPVNLREKLNLKDGDEVAVSVQV
jgi:riboflavin kinase